VLTTGLTTHEDIESNGETNNSDEDKIALISLNLVKVIEVEEKVVAI